MAWARKKDGYPRQLIPAAFGCFGRFSLSLSLSLSLSWQLVVYITVIVVVTILPITMHLPSQNSTLKSSYSSMENRI